MILPMLRGLPVVLILAAGCGGGLAPLPMPVGMAPGTVAEAEVWTSATHPPDYREIRFGLQFLDEQGATGGRGRARYASPDSLRFDLVGSLGAWRAAAFVAGDSAIWADPEEEVQKLVPNYPLFWAMLGIARSPRPGTVVRRFADGTVTAWQFAVGGDTLEYVRESGGANRLIAEVRQGGKRLGRVETKFGADGHPASSRLVVPGRGARLDLTFRQNEKTGAFAPDTWTRPAPPER